MKTRDAINPYHPARSSGFSALIAVVMLALGSLTFSLVALETAHSYADSVMRTEWRIQARLNAKSCLESILLMLAKDAYLEGEVALRDFGCRAQVVRSASGISADIHVSVIAYAVDAAARASLAAVLRQGKIDSVSFEDPFMEI